MTFEWIQVPRSDTDGDRDDPDFYNSDWSDSKNDLDAEDWEETLQPEGMNGESDEPFDMKAEMEKDAYGDDEEQPDRPAL